MLSRQKPVVVTFLGDLGTSPIETMVGAARTAATLDSMETALGSKAISNAILVTDCQPAGSDLPGLTIDLDSGEFHFGQRLAAVIRAHGLESLIYLGGGSVPLLQASDFTAITAELAAGHAVTNNLYSSDLVAFSVTDGVLAVVEGVARDNALARALVEGAGASMTELPRTVETLFDIDSPTDVAGLKLTRRGGQRLHRALDSAGLDTTRYERLLPVFLDQRRQLIVAGRVGSHIWRYLETETACRVRLFAEERGMDAEGRAEDGTARSLLGAYLGAVGVDQFFQSLAEMGDAVLLDSRVLAAHARARPSREDRFLSDDGRSSDIADAFLAELTEAAQRADIPVLLGGHSLMSGTLILLNEHAWQLRDRKLI
jgi:hypothetical protein